MKNIRNIIKQTKILTIAASLSMISMVGFAQSGPPPPPSGDPDGTVAQDNKLGANANIGGGVLILLALGLAYGGKRLYDLKKEQKEEIA